MTTNEINFLTPVVFVILTIGLASAWMDGSLMVEWGVYAFLAIAIWLVFLIGTLIWLWGLASSFDDS